MKKRIISIILSVVMLVGLLPNTALAADSHTDHCACGAEHKSIGDHTTETIKTFKVWDNTTSLPSSGNYYLNKDVALTATANITGELNLCLNGHSITKESGTAIKVISGETLNICDCKGSGSISATSNNADITGIDNSGNVNIYGGTVKATRTGYSGSGTGIKNTNGSVTVSGGVIDSSTTGITNAGGTLTVSGGAVKGASTGISTNSDITISGSPNITGGCAIALYLSSKIIIGGALGTLTNAISVNMDNKGTFTSGWTTKMGDAAANYSSFFTAWSNSYTVQKNNNGELELAAPTTYTVTYNASGATSGTVPTDGNSYTSGSTVTVLGNTGALAKTGYAFVGWNTRSNGDGTDYAPGATFNINSNTTLYAQWEEYEITSQPVENDPSVGTNADSDIASYQWYKGTMSDVTDATEGVSAYTENTLTSSYSDGWWTCHEAGRYSTPGYFTIVLNAGDSILAQTSDVIDDAQLGIVGAAQDWDWTTPDDHFLVTAPADGNYDLHVSDVTYGGGTQPTVKAQVFHIGNTPAEGATGKTLVAAEDGWYACKITYADGTVLYSGPVEYEAPSIPVTGVELDKSSITLDVNGTAKLAATVFPDDATDKTVSWTSSDPTVAKVENGVVTALKPGTVTITVTTNDDSFTDTCTVTVNKIAITGMLEITTENEPVVGERFTIGSVTYTPGNYTISATSFSPSASDSPIQAGKVYTLSVTFKPYSGYFFGENIQATFNDKAVEITRLDIGGTIYLQIEHTYSFPAAVPNSVDILRNGAPADTASILLPGINENAATMDFTAKTLDQYGQEMTGQTVEWSITGTNTTGISVNNGTVTVTEDASKGNYTLTATCDGKSDSITIKVEKAESVATSIKIFKGENEVTADTIYIPEQYRNTVNYTAVVYDQYGEVMSADDAEITKTHTNKTIDNLTIASTEVESNRSWDYFVDAASGKAGSFDLVLTSGNASASVRITFAVLTPQTIICANVTGTYGQTEELKLNPSGKQTAGAYSFAIKSGASTDVVEVASDGKLTIKNAGETTIVVTAPSDATHASASVEVKVTIDKADITEYTDPTANDLTYNGSAQALITEGSATGGTMYYALGGSYNPTRDWSTNVPTGTDAKTYYVWYKVVGDRNHNNKNFETPITVTIAPNTYIVTYLPGINGTGTQTTDTKTQGVDLTLKGAIFTRTGYTQTGWATTDGGEKVYDLNGTYSANAAVSLYPVWTANTYTVTLNAGGATINSNNVTGYTYGVGATLPAAGDMTKASHRFDGWYESDNFGGSPVTAISTTATGDKTYYAKWTEVHTITGVVKDSESNGIDGVTVELMQGNDQFGTTTTANGGQFSFTSVPLGSYNVVAEQTVSGGTKTKTEMVIIEHENAELTIVMPSQNVSSTLNVSGSSTPDVVVGGLDDEAADQTHSNAAGSDTHVSIGMSIEAKEDVTSGDSGSSEEASQQTTIKQAASAQQLDKVEFLSITVTKTVTTNGTPDNGTELKQTQTVLELIIPYSLAGKYNIGIYRHHDGRAEAFAALGSQPDEQAKRDKTFWIDTGKELIHIYTNRFSNYAIAYSDAPVATPTPNPTPSGGDYTPTYAITVEKAEHGTIKANRTYASYGSTVTITTEPEDGYVLSSLTVTDSQGNKIEATDKGDGTYTFKMPRRKVTVTAVFTMSGSYSICPGDSSCPIYPFTDADPSAWYHDGVHYCIDNGLMAGYGNGIFKPNADTTRAMITVMLWRLNGSPVVNYLLDFKDVEEGQWYTEAIRWAKSEGVAEGYGNGYFGTNDAITREQMVTILWRYAQYKGVDVSVGENTNILSYNDAFDVAEYAIPAMQWACGSGMVQGMNDPDGEGMILAPESKGTRAQIATMIMRFCEEILK